MDRIDGLADQSSPHAMIEIDRALQCEIEFVQLGKFAEADWIDILHPA